MKYTDEQIDSFIAAMGVQLLPYQREMFKKLMNTDKVYIIMPPRVGWSDYLYLSEMMKVIMEG